MQLRFLESAQKVSKMDVKVVDQFCPLLFFQKQKKIPTCAKESALIPDVENLLQ